VLLYKGNKTISNDPIKKIHYAGSSVVVTIDPKHVKRLKIDELTFFVQKPIENGILLEKGQLSTDWEEKND
jgi:hypothetical protein